jgi:hypothetical protein
MFLILRNHAMNVHKTAEKKIVMNKKRINQIKRGKEIEKRMLKVVVPRHDVGK